MTKIVFIGAGSLVFAKNLIGDCMLTPALSDSEFALLDIDKEKLAFLESILKNLNDNINEGRATVKAYDIQREALKDADYVINAIQVGGDSAIIKDFEIPLKYGLKQTYGDTLGIGGIFRGLRTIPVVLQIAKEMEEVCPKAWLLNYTNPMAIVTGAIQRATKIKTVGLCHSVQICARDLLAGLGMDNENVQYKIAGINHQAWLLEVKKNGVDLYPEIKRRSLQRTEKHDDMVRYEIMNRFDYYVTESTQHSAEYLPYFIKHRYPELLERYNIDTNMYKEWESQHKEYWEKLKKEYTKAGALKHTRTHEFASYILESLKTGKLYKIAANVLNHGYITNLTENSCVEIPCMVDAGGITPCFAGELPPQCAALNQTNINMQNLTIEAGLTGNRRHVYHAAMLDPHTAAELSIDDIVKLCDELMEENKIWLTNMEL